MTRGKGQRPERDVQVTVEPAGPVAAGSPARVREEMAFPPTAPGRGTGRARRVTVPLVVLQSLVGLLALLGGWQMLTGRLGLDPEWLRRTPFPDWTLPALALMLLPGAGELVAAAAVLRRHRYARPLAILSGLGLLAWILLQLAWLQIVHPVMQPAIALAGALITVLAWLLPRAPERRRGGAEQSCATSEGRH